MWSTKANEVKKKNTEQPAADREDQIGYKII